MGRRRSIAAGIGALSLLLALAAWIGGQRADAPPPSPVQPTATPTKAAPKPPSTLPLTGRRAKGEAPNRPAIAVKIDNTRPSRPQVGLESADLIVEELAEGGATRLVAFFHSTLPKRVGPVRSLRTSDIGIVRPTGGLLVASGGAQVAIRKVQAAGIPLAEFEGAGFERDRARRRPYNLFVRPAGVLRAAAALKPPPNYLPWRATGTPGPSPSTKPARRLVARFSPMHTTSWQYVDGRGWRRDNDLASAGDTFVADNVLVIRVKTRDAGYRDPAGNPVPETVTAGSGGAQLLFGADLVTAKWHKADAAGPWRFTTADGAELRIPPGRTWIELVPQGGSATVS